MAEYLIQGETLTKLGDEVRTISGTTSTMNPDVMTSNLEEANINIVTESDLISQIQTALVGKTSGTLDTSDATATAADIVKDKTAYVNGEKVTGSVNVTEAGETYYTIGTQETTTITGELFHMDWTITNDMLLRKNSIVSSIAHSSLFGTATADKVLAGETFTAKDGLLVTGELVVPTIHTGSSTPDSSLGSDGDIYFVVQEV